MSTQSVSERPGTGSQNAWPIALVFAGAAFAAQTAAWWVWSPAVMAGGSVATVGLLLCLPYLWRRHREDVVRASGSQDQAEQIRRAAEAQLAGERAQMDERWQAWRNSQLEAFHESVETWYRNLQTVLTERGKPETTLPKLNPRTAELLEKALEEVDEELVDVQDACEHAVVFLAQRLQAGGLQIQEKTTGLMGRPEPGLPELGMEIDHLATTFAHHAQSLRILGGSWTGQQWQQTVPLTDIVRAAGGQITDYRRVVIGGEPDLGVRDFAAEWLIHLVAELLSNATTYSPGTKEVTAQLEAVPSGAVIQIDDRGTGMTEARLQRAQELVAGERDVTLRDLQTPQVGLAVVGNIARRLNIGVSLGRSPYGGIRAVVLVPMDLLEAVDPVDTMPLPGTPSGQATPLPDERGGPRVAAPSALPHPVPDPVPHPAPEAVPQPAASAGTGEDGPEEPRTGDLPRRRSAEGGGAAPTALPRRRSPRHSRPAPVAQPDRSGAPADDDPDAAASFMSTFVLGGRTGTHDENDSPQGENHR